MDNNPLEVLKTKSEWLYLLLASLSIFLINLSFLFYQYHNFKTEEIYQVQGYVQNIYPKERYNVIKIKTDEFEFFTSIDKDIKVKKLDRVETNILTTKIDFLSYLKGFYTKSINLNIDKNHKHTKHQLYEKINKQHTNEQISQIYAALFLAVPVQPFLRDIFSNYAVSHLVAISGFHLGIISFLIYWFAYIFYRPLQDRFFPYRNRRFDLLLISIVGLFSYLVYIEFVASFLRAFVMFIIGVYLLRHNIKLISFQTLALTIIFIIVFFPKLLFSLSLWLSIAGVFYIFLFIKYFKDLNKILAFVLFNIWIFLALNPIVHYIFPTTSFMQLFSPIFTILFTLFYPISLALHIIGYGDIFDGLIEFWLVQEVYTKELFTSPFAFVSYLAISFLSIFSKKVFLVLNFALCTFNIYIFAQL